MSASDISKAIKRKTDAQLRLKMADTSRNSTESPSGTVVFVDPSVYTKPLVAGKNVTISEADGIRIVDANMNIIPGEGITVTDPDPNGSVTISAEESDAFYILGKKVNITNFSGKDGFVLAYSAANDSFYLKEVSGGSGGDVSMFESIVLTLSEPYMVNVHFESIIIIP